MQIPYRLAFYHTVQTIDNNEGDDAAVIWMCIIDQIVEAVIDPLHTCCEADQGTIVLDCTLILGVFAAMGNKDINLDFSTPGLHLALLSQNR